MSAINYSVFEKNFRKLNLLGKGSSSSVFKALHLSQMKYYALKQSFLKDYDQLCQAFQEIETINSINHASIIKIHYYYIRTSSKKQIQLGIIMDLASGSLQDEIMIRQKKKKYFSYNEIWYFIEQIINALSQLQKINIIHRDIKPQNILIFDGVYKLTDFGYAVKQHLYSEKTIAGSHQYASPKLRKKFQNSKLFIPGNNAKDDVYSLGITLMQMMFLAPLDHHKKQQRLHFVNKYFGNRIYELLKLMLLQDQQQRMDFIQLENYIKLTHQKYQKTQKKIHNQKTLAYSSSSGALNNNIKIQQNHKNQDIITKRKNKQQDKYSVKERLLLTRPIHAICCHQNIILLGMQLGIGIIYQGQAWQYNFFEKKKTITCIQYNPIKKQFICGGLDNIIRLIKQHDLLVWVQSKQKNPKEDVQLIITSQTIDNPVSSIHILDLNTEQIKNPYVFGHYNGFATIPYAQIKKSFSFSGSITQAKLQNTYIYTSDSQGIFKKSKVNQDDDTNSSKSQYGQQTYYAQNPIINFTFIEQQEQTYASLITSNGFYHLVSLKSMKCEKLFRLTKQIILTCIFFNNGELIAGTDSGNLYNSQGKKILQSPIKGISSLQKINQMILIGSYGGQLALVEKN